MLAVENLDVRYGAIQALRGVSLEVRAGEIVTLIGSNGAGKSSTLRAICGLVRPVGGRISLDGCDLTRMRPHAIARAGVGHAPEGRRVFSNLTVRENLELGAYWRGDVGAVKDDMRSLLRLFPRLGERRNQLAGTLSGGEQQMLAIARALMGRPRLLLLDEPSLGLAPFLVKEIFRTIKGINEEGRTVLLVEQNAHQALALAHRGYVLESGQIVLSDSARNLENNELVRKAYLGE